MASSGRPLRRWVLRLVRREWREHLLIVAMIATATALASFGTVAVFHASQPPSAFTGTATVRLTSFDPATDREVLDLITDGTFGAVDITGVRRVSRDGSSFNFGLADPPALSVLGADRVRLVDGRRPDAPRELGVSEPLAETLGIGIGDVVPIDGIDMLVVGFVEDPSNLGAVAGIVAPGTLDDPDEVFILTSASVTDLAPFVRSGLGLDVLTGNETDRLFSVLSLYLLATVAMVEIALICTAAFTVLAQRRLRQFGLLSAVGATSRQIGRTLRSNAFALGVVGGTFGVGVGYAASIAARPWMERNVGWRMDSWSMPMLVLVPYIVLAAVTAVAGAWWPARRLTQMAPVDALSSRRPAAKPTTRKGFIGVVIFVGGALLLSFGIASETTAAAVFGLVVAVAGVLLVTPLLVAAAGRLAAHLPLGSRIALRDIARNQTRSAACLAALVIAFGIPTAIIVTSASADANLEAGPPNLPDNWAIVSVQGGAWGDLPIGFSPNDHQSSIDRLAERLPNAEITPVNFLTATTSAPQDGDFRSTVRVSRLLDSNAAENMFAFRDFPTWVATPALLDAVGADPALATSAAAVLGDSSQVVFVGRVEVNNETGEAVGGTVPEPIDLVRFGALPEFWIPESQIDHAQYTPITGAWLITQTGPFTDEEKAIIFDGAGADLEVETRRPNQNDTELRRAATLIGAVVALAILALTVSLLLADSRNEQRVLIALGTKRHTRRRITAATTGFLALSGALLALPVGYLALVAIMSDRDANFAFVVPATPLGALLIGTPLIATAAAYLLTGRSRRDLVQVTV